jgi:hypothetical protein
LTYAKIKTMKKIVLFIILCYSVNITGQSETTPTDFNFGTAANFILFTGAGAVANTGISTITGDVGSHAGAIAGFGSPSVLTGTIENTNSITEQAALDLAAACVQLQNIPATITDHSTIYGNVNGETIYPGVYSAAAAVAITGTLILDAQGDPNAMFIFKITGALNSVAGATVILANGALSDNVFWIAVGAVALGANTTMVGTAIAYPGAVSLGAGSTIGGSLYSTAGAIAIDSTVGTIPLGSIFYDSPFNCVLNAYLFQDNDIYGIDLASGSSYQVAADVTPGNINAAAYNPTDGYIWGSLSTPEKTIVRIDKNFRTRTYYVDELPLSGRYVGGVSAEGIYYLKGDGTVFYKIDLDPNSENYTQHQSTESLSQSLSIHDWAFNALDGQLYTVEKATNLLYRINPLDGTAQSLGEVPILTGLNYTYGAVYFDVSGRFYVSANQTGTIYVIQSVQDILSESDIDSNLFAFGPSSSSNDGARCPTAPVPQEICDNGIDDDGDGLIDCEDPSCSGFGLCDVIEAPTSGANDGGLESNNRLAEQINKRNFNRVKSNYMFDKSTAKKFIKKLRYKGGGDSNFTIQDFIPLNTINEDQTIETTPTDLLSITNATDIFAVDYMKDNKSIASVLVLKTESGVYEHTKYICDRLLGGELISVSTIEIREQTFIKSIIKNVDGAYEFVLSLSAKLINNKENFSIESHWNIDQYEKDITFYNFQIWSNSIDDLYVLGEEVLHLLNIENPISTYNNSAPPAVYVRKGNYSNGALNLQIINTNKTFSVAIDAGYRRTETSEFDNLNTTINLNGYITDITLDTGNIFDIGFRIGDGTTTPDDLFMSDGPWGVDDSQSSTTINNFSVLQNNSNFEYDDFPIERNVVLTATTATYVAAYRALTPTFQAVDVSNYTSFNLSAMGNGELEITFLKKSISIWENQFKANIQLTNKLQEFTIPILDIQSNNGDELNLTDIVTIVFTMTSETGESKVIEMNIQDLYFSQKSLNTLSTEDLEINAFTLSAIPNPMSSNTEIHFTATQQEIIEFLIYDTLGRVVYSIKHSVISGNNIISLNREELSTGLFICKIVNNQFNYNPLKLIVR